jgi:hypothetical protein
VLAVLACALCWMLRLGRLCVPSTALAAIGCRAAWEGRDVQVVGVVAALPHGFEGGERFEFDVESVETAGARLPRTNHAFLVSRPP